MIEQTDIADLLIKLRSKLGMRELVKKSGISQGVIKNYIAGESEPRWRRGVQIYNLAIQELGEVSSYGYG